MEFIFVKISHQKKKNAQNIKLRPELFISYKTYETETLKKKVPCISTNSHTHTAVLLLAL